MAQTQLISLVAEGVVNAAKSGEVLNNLHPARIFLTSSVAKIASYSIFLIAAGYTTGVLFEKVFPNIRFFKRNVLGIRRRKRVSAAKPKKSPNDNAAAAVEPETVPATKTESSAEVPMFGLPSWQRIWATACLLAQPLTNRLHL